MTTRWYTGYDGIEYPEEVDDRREEPRMMVDWQAAYAHRATVEALCAMAIDEFAARLESMDPEEAKYAALRELGEGIAAYPDIEEMEQERTYPFFPKNAVIGDGGLVDGEELPF